MKCRCAKCQQKYEFEADMEGTAIECDNCGNQVLMQNTITEPPIPLGDPGDRTHKKPMINMGSKIIGISAVCVLLTMALFLMQRRDPEKRARVLFSSAANTMREARENANTFQESHAKYREALLSLETIVQNLSSTEIATHVIGGHLKIDGYDFNQLRGLESKLSTLSDIEDDWNRIWKVAAEKYENEESRREIIYGHFLARIKYSAIEPSEILNNPTLNNSDKVSLLIAQIPRQYPFGTTKAYDDIIDGLNPAVVRSNAIPEDMLTRATSAHPRFIIAHLYLELDQPEEAKRHAMAYQGSSLGNTQTMLISRFVHYHDAMENDDEAAKWLEALNISTGDTRIGITRRFEMCELARGGENSEIHNRNKEYGLRDRIRRNNADEVLKYVNQNSISSSEGLIDHSIRGLIDYAIRHRRLDTAYKLVNYWYDQHKYEKQGSELSQTGRDYALLSRYLQIYSRRPDARLAEEIIARLKDIISLTENHSQRFRMCGEIIQNLWDSRATFQDSGWITELYELMQKSYKVIVKELEEQRGVLEAGSVRRWRMVELGKAARIANNYDNMSLLYFAPSVIERDFPQKMANRTDEDSVYRELRFALHAYDSLASTSVSRLDNIAKALGEDYQSLEIAKRYAAIGYIGRAVDHSKYLGRHHSTVDGLVQLPQMYAESAARNEEENIRAILAPHITDDVRRFFASGPLRTHKLLRK